MRHLFTTPALVVSLGVAAPLHWDELDEAIGPAWFTLRNMPTRLASLPTDPWDGFRAAAAPLEAARGKAR